MTLQDCSKVAFHWYDVIGVGIPLETHNSQIEYQIKARIKYVSSLINMLNF